jgi:hypothetical protein
VAAKFVITWLRSPLRHQPVKLELVAIVWLRLSSVHLFWQISFGSVLA